MADLRLPGITFAALLAALAALAVLAFGLPALPACADEPAAATGPAGEAPQDPASQHQQLEPGLRDWAIQSFSRTSYGWIGIGWLLVFVVAGFIARGIVRSRWLAATRETETLVDDLLAASFARIVFVGLGAAGVLGGGYFLLYYFIEQGGPLWQERVTHIVKIAVVLFFLYAAFHLIGVGGQFVKERFGRTKTEVDDQLAVLVARVLKTAVIVAALIMLLDMVGVPVTAVLVGLAIVLVAGFLLAFDVLRDVAGSLQLLGAPPFDVGHVIEIDGIVGVVRRIGLRTTTLETPERTQVVIPNHRMVRMPVENFSCRASRRYSYTLELAPDTPVAALQEAVTAIGELLLAEPVVIRRTPKLAADGEPLLDANGEPVMAGSDPLVTIEAIEDGMIAMLVQYDLSEVSMPKAAPVQQRLVLGVLEVLESRGVAFANASGGGSNGDGGGAGAAAPAKKSPRKKPAPKKKKKTTTAKKKTAVASDENGGSGGGE